MMQIFCEGWLAGWPAAAAAGNSSHLLSCRRWSRHSLLAALEKQHIYSFSPPLAPRAGELSVVSSCGGHSSATCCFPLLFLLSSREPARPRRLFIRTWQVWTPGLYCWTHWEHVPHTVTVNGRRVPHGEFVKASQSRGMGNAARRKLVFITAKVGMAPRVWVALLSGFKHSLECLTQYILFYSRGFGWIGSSGIPTVSPQPGGLLFFFPFSSVSLCHLEFIVSSPGCFCLPS